MDTVQRIDLEEVRKWVEEHIKDFHASRLESLKAVKLMDLLKKKNPYLFRAKGIITAQGLIESLLNAALSSSEETIMGNFLEELALFVVRKTVDGQKSGTKGVDFEYTLGDTRYLFSMKSGAHWGNASQWDDLLDSFQRAIKVINQSKQVKNVKCYLGISYGKSRATIRKGIINQVSGQEFWYMISGRSDFYTEIIEPIGHEARKHNDEFETQKGNLINQLTKEVLKEFSNPDGSLKWKEIVEYNSKNLQSRDQ